MKSLVIKRSIIIGGRKTSVSLEDAFWSALKDIASRRAITVSTLVSEIDAQRGRSSLSSAIRLFVLDSVRNRTSEGLTNENLAKIPASAMLVSA